MSDDIDPDLRALVASQARQLAHRFEFLRQDRDDLEQELLLRLVRALPKFDARRGARKAFAQTVVARAAASLIRDRQVPQRHPRCTRPLAAPGTVLDPDSEDRTEAAVDPSLDVAAVLADLPAAERRLAEHLQEGNVTEAARRLGLARSTVVCRVRRLRERFERAGLAPYLHAGAASRPRPE